LEIKQLKQLLKLLRAEGVTDYKTPELELKLGELPTKESDKEPETPEDRTGFPTGVLSNEALMFYSSGGIPGEEPEGLIDGM